MNLNRWEWSNSQGRLVASPRAPVGYQRTERYWDPVTNGIYTPDPRYPRFHLDIYNALNKEGIKRRTDPKCESSTPLIKEWKHEACLTILDIIKELSSKYNLPSVTIKQIEITVGNMEMNQWGKCSYECNYKTIKAWSIKASKLIHPENGHEVG
jgi:hypothetical protein